MLLLATQLSTVRVETLQSLASSLRVIRGSGLLACSVLFMVWGRLVIVQDVEDAREGRVEEGGEGAAEKRSPEQDGEEFGHWWKTSTLQDSFAFVKHLSANTL